MLDKHSYKLLSWQLHRMRLNQSRWEHTHPVNLLKFNGFINVKLQKPKEALLVFSSVFIETLFWSRGSLLLSTEYEFQKWKVSFQCLILPLMWITSIITITWVNMANQRWGVGEGGASSQLLLVRGAARSLCCCHQDHIVNVFRPLWMIVCAM